MRRTGLPLAAVVLGSTLLDGLLAIPIRRPRIFGDELIYWLLGRSFAWSGSFTLRGGAAPRYGVVYPAVEIQSAIASLCRGIHAGLFALPARLTAQIRAAPSVGEAMTLFTSELRATLTELARLTSRGELRGLGSREKS